ncbi:hypothetical protein HY214_03645 [Candidatus Roizmanbacteria bacterium]|nr:hypothetical protein [Candidatus Roizmanbacteria bacterium]
MNGDEEPIDILARVQMLFLLAVNVILRVFQNLTLTVFVIFVFLLFLLLTVFKIFRPVP